MIPKPVRDDAVKGGGWYSVLADVDHTASFYSTCYFDPLVPVLSPFYPPAFVFLIESGI